MNEKILILGLGNVLLKDEGAGIAAINIIRDSFRFIGDVDIIDGGTLGLDLLHIVGGCEKVLIVDAVDFGKEPGYVGLLEKEEIPQTLFWKPSAHNIGLSDLMSALRLIEQMPDKLCLVGIQPEALTPGIEISVTILNQMNKLLELVKTRLKEWNVECV